MRRSLYAFLLPIVCVSVCSSQVAIAQTDSIGTLIETGFAVITPLGGDGQGLSVSEVFGQEINGILFRSSVLPSPLVTATSVFTRTDPSAAVDTGIAIVNPNAVSATVVLSLNNEQGITIATRTITVDGRQQISRFVLELFFGTPQLSAPFAGLLFITSDIPVGVLGLAFTGPSFTSLPVATQLNTTGVITPGTSTFVIGGLVPQTPTVPVNTATVPINTAGAIPPVAPIPPVPQTITTPLPITITQVPNTITQVPSTFSGLPPTVPTIGNATPITTTTPAFTTTTPVSTTSGTGFILVRGDVIFVFPQIEVGVGGIAAQLLPQVATGGGWQSTIAIANTSGVDQVVRADFFNSQGGALVLPFGSSVTNILVPAAGVVTLSTN
jgi:hypothetical protein